MSYKSIIGISEFKMNDVECGCQNYEQCKIKLNSHSASTTEHNDCPFKICPHFDEFMDILLEAQDTNTPASPLMRCYVNNL